ncbi:ubiquinol-cytochrome c reductase iron-sulfur subunit [Nocardioides antri]|uniref:Cytochrome bc1 complex Rieske iron-sulfur subunit n=1 Tax=Nocardioides antri TaxID=2607659 RepID=A0A5B1MBD1_9ACTN|nr:Rieske (2Fe-2S) protein [Nocardioides antri]KAA1429237.1 Rieske (2Fe-2S) protein [Nocardioides antri]
MTIKRSTISRRRALGGAAGLGVGLPLLAACGDDGSDSGSDPATSDPASPTSADGKPSASESAPAGEGIATSEVPVGGGIIADQVVITQPTEGEFKAFTAVCTHQQCLVGDVSGGTINCPCHGSQFSIEDGSVTAGPAPSPLDTVGLSVDGGRIVVG